MEKNCLKIFKKLVNVKRDLNKKNVKNVYYIYGVYTHGRWLIEVLVD